MAKAEYYFERKVNYYETDKMGIVHHSNYIRWFEEARVEYMDSKNYPYSKMESLGVMIPVLYVDCQYRTPVKFGQTVIIHVWVENFAGAKMDVGYEVTDKESGKLCVTGHTGHCFVAADTFRPLRLQKTHPEMAAVFMPDETEADESGAG